jgi:hypothetical protein
MVPPRKGSPQAYHSASSSGHAIVQPGEMLLRHLPARVNKKFKLEAKWILVYLG